MVRCTITKVLTQLDCVILMHLSGGTVFSVLSLWGYRTCHYEAEGPKGIRHCSIRLWTVVLGGGYQASYHRRRDR